MMPWYSLLVFEAETTCSGATAGATGSARRSSATCVAASKTTQLVGMVELAVQEMRSARAVWEPCTGREFTACSLFFLHTPFVCVHGRMPLHGERCKLPRVSLLSQQHLWRSVPGLYEDVCLGKPQDEPAVGLCCAAGEAVAAVLPSNLARWCSAEFAR
jgi:hypothetical protein